MKTGWENTIIHGQQHIKNTDTQFINEKDTFIFLSRETEIEKTAAHDQALSNKYCTTKVLKIADDSKCRMRQQSEGQVYLSKSECTQASST
jgi:hypothetical protein